MVTLQKIALLNFGGIGDELLFTPVIHAVRKAFPNAQITLLLETRSRKIKDLLPEIDSVIDIDLSHYTRWALFFKLWRTLRQGHFNAVISSGSSPFIALMLGLSGIPVRIGFNSGKLSQILLSAAAPLDRQCYAGQMYFSLAKTFIKAIRKEKETAWPVPVPTVTVDAESVLQMKTLLADCESNVGRPSRVMIHPGVSKMSIEKNILKSWPQAHYESLMQHLCQADSGLQVYLLGGPDDAETLTQLEAYRQRLPTEQRARIRNLYGRTQSLGDLAALIQLADVLISVDSAPMHLAVALKTPVVAIFGPTDPVKLLPNRPDAIAVARQDLACRPCLWAVRQTSCESPVCLTVDVQSVLQETLKLLRPQSTSINMS